MASLREDIALGDLVITTGAVRLENTTSFYVEDGYPAVADYTAVLALLEAAKRTGHPAHLGLTATAPGFFGAQGRPIPQLPLRFPDMAERMARQGVINFEMEASAVLTLAALAGCRAGVVCTVFAQRTTGEFVMRRAEAGCRGRAHRDRPGGAARARRDGSRSSQRPARSTGVPHTGRQRWQPNRVSRMASNAANRNRGSASDRAREGTEHDHTLGGIGGNGMAEAYCVKDKQKVEIQNPQKITMKNGKPATKGTCPKCGGSVFRIGG